jgi:diguanylate cyclase (GGDEF)-like protein/PAS domain S-box-containing protein
VPGCCRRQSIGQYREAAIRIGVRILQIREPEGIGQQVIGVISVESEEPDAFTEQDERLLATVAGQLSNALERQRVEAALRFSEERYRLISNLSTDYVFSSRVESNGNIIEEWASGASEIITGYTPAELNAIGGWKTIIYPDDMAIDDKARTKLYSNEVAIHEIRIITKSGTPRWLREYIHPVWDDQENRVVSIYGAVQDITERKRAEESLREAEAKYRTLLEHIPPIVYVSAREQYIGVTYISPQIETLGFTQSEWIADPELWFRQIHPDDQPGVLAEIERFKQDGDVFRSEYRLRTHDGVTKWFFNESTEVIDNQGNFLFRQGFMLDITERKQAEEREVQRRATLEKVVKLGKLVTEAADLKTTLTRIWHGVHDELGFDRLAIFLYNQETHSVYGTLGTDNNGNIVEEWEYVRSLSQGRPTSFIRALEQPDGVYFTNNFAMEFGIPESHEMYGVEDFAAVTAWGGEKPVAIISVDNFPSKRIITNDQLEALRLFAGYAGLAIENSRLNTNLENRVAERTAQLNEANESLHQEKIRLEQYSRQRELMGTMTDLLQASLTTEEASGIVSRYMQLLFPNRDGALYLLNTSGMLEPIAIWGEQKSLNTIFGMNDCWALRRGQIHEVVNPQTDLLCSHFTHPPQTGYLCLPLTVQGKALGLLCLVESATRKGERQLSQQQLAVTVGETIKLSLSNLNLREELRHQAFHDPLTGLFNRRYLDETLPRELLMAQRRNAPLCVVMLDIDGFKQFNDSFGHGAGDSILREFGRILREKLRKSDISCRYGGDEFVLILSDSSIADTQERVTLYTRVREILAEDKPYIFLYHPSWIWVHSTKLKGFVAHPDGITRVLDLRLD